MSQSDPAPARPRPAATVVIVRDASNQSHMPNVMEVLLAKRAASLRFMANAHVFPGGAVHASDSDPALQQQLSSPARPWPTSSDPQLDSAHAWAAIRETLEEVGLLLASPPVDAALIRELRARVEQGGAFASLLAQAGLQLDLHALVPLIRWITPTSEPIRFDARFFVVRAPADQIAHPDGYETSELVWLSPRDAISLARRAELLLFAPTLRTLEQLASFSSVSALMEHATHATAPTIEPILHTRSDGSRVVVYPDGKEQVLPSDPS
jgi:8-oxo-dGTP pyrophosphatase MutT (NUDIX family)